MPHTPLLKVAVLNDYPVVVLGLSTLLSEHDSRIQVIGLEPHGPLPVGIDIVLWDAFARQQPGAVLAHLKRHSKAQIALFAGDLTAELVGAAIAAGVTAYVSKRSSPEQLIRALEAIHDGNPIESLDLSQPEIFGLGDWPGRSVDLTSREAEIIAYIASGHSNLEIAAALFLSVNTIKTSIRSAYRKIGVQRRTQAMLWAVENGFVSERHHFGAIPEALDSRPSGPS